MFAKCSNPDCGAPFNYREGQLVRFCKPPLEHRSSTGQHHVEHFWLCGSCSNLYMLECERGAGMKISLRTKELGERAAFSFVATA